MDLMLTYPHITVGVNKHSKVSSGQFEHCPVDRVLDNVCIFYRIQTGSESNSFEETRMWSIDLTTI